MHLSIVYVYVPVCVAYVSGTGDNILARRIGTSGSGSDLVDECLKRPDRSC